MSTQLTRVPGGYIISTVIAPGKRKKMARKAVRVGDADMVRVIAEMVSQADSARAELGIRTQREVPVV